MRPSPPHGIQVRGVRGGAGPWRSITRGLFRNALWPPALGRRGTPAAQSGQKLEVRVRCLEQTLGSNRPDQVAPPSGGRNDVCNVTEFGVDNDCRNVCDRDFGLQPEDTDAGPGRERNFGTVRLARSRSRLEDIELRRLAAGRAGTEQEPQQVCTLPNRSHRMGDSQKHAGTIEARVVQGCVPGQDGRPESHEVGLEHRRNRLDGSAGTSGRHGSPDGCKADGWPLVPWRPNRASACHGATNVTLFNAGLAEIRCPVNSNRHHLEVSLADPAIGTHPVLGDFGPRCSGGNAIFRPAGSFVVHEPAYDAHPNVH